MKYMKYIGGHKEYDGIELNIGDVYSLISYVNELNSTEPNIQSVLITNSIGVNKWYIFKDVNNQTFFKEVTQEYVRNKIITKILE